MTTIEAPSSATLPGERSSRASSMAKTKRRPKRQRGWVSGFALGFLVFVFAVILLLPLLPVVDPNEQSLIDALAAPSGTHWLGTDELGRDLLARLLHGARTTVLSALLAVAIAFVIGVPLGLISGYVRGVVDAVLSRIADALMAVPPLILLLSAIAALGQGITKSMIVLGVILAPRLFRVVRASTISLSTSEFFEVGRMSGCGLGRILTRYVLPNIRSQVVVQVTILMGYAVLTEASISFLGLGVKAPDPSLGVLLKTAIEFLPTAPVLTIAPGLLITAFILACNLIGDAYSDRKDRR